MLHGLVVLLHVVREEGPAFRRGGLRAAFRRMSVCRKTPVEGRACPTPLVRPGEFDHGATENGFVLESEGEGMALFTLLEGIVGAHGEELARQCVALWPSFFAAYNPNEARGLLSERLIIRFWTLSNTWPVLASGLREGLSTESSVKKLTVPLRLSEFWALIWSSETRTLGGCPLSRASFTHTSIRSCQSQIVTCSPPGTAIASCCGRT